MASEWLELNVAEENPDNTAMECYVVTPEGEGPWPGIILFMEIFGVNTHIRDVAERLASEGYVVIAPNYYHRSTKNLELGYTEADVEAGREHKEKTTRAGILADVKQVMAYLNQREDVAPKNRFGTIGFCFGGHVGYIAAGLPEIAATASYYGGGVAVESPGGGEPTVSYTKNITGQILCFFGGNDPLIPQEHTEIVESALKEAGTNHMVVRYSGVDHGFNCDRRESYHAAAALDAWGKSLKMFETRLRTSIALS